MGLTRMLVLCDDLTGAGAYAGEVTELGVAAHVVLAADRLFNGVTVLDLETRDRLPAAAAAAARAAIDRLVAGDSTVLLARRVDTSLRGPITEELDVALAAAVRDRVVLAPAYPSAGRTTIAGRQRLSDGNEIDLAPFVPASLRARIGGDEPPTAGECWIPDVDDVDAVRRVAESIAALGADGSRLLLADAGPVGAAVARGVLSIPPRAVLVVVGSSTDLVRRQVGRLRDASLAGVEVLARPLAGSTDPELARLVAEARRCLESGRFGAVVLCGGLTAGAVLRSLGITHLDPAGLLAPLVSLLHARGPAGPLLVGLKGGHVGPEDSFVATVKHLQAELAR